MFYIVLEDDRPKPSDDSGGRSIKRKYIWSYYIQRICKQWFQSCLHSMTCLVFTRGWSPSCKRCSKGRMNIFLCYEYCWLSVCYYSICNTVLDKNVKENRFQVSHLIRYKRVCYSGNDVLNMYVICQM
jgi:hypothetical protein